ncbi:MAG: AgmX/PglI C-terminal domain-containing protein [Polyangiales bacterium]
MAQKLVVPITFQIYQNGALVRTETIAQDVIKIGRDQKSHLRIDDEGVARMHAVIEAKPDDVQIIDLGSGTQVNGQPINKASLRTSDTFQIGNTRITVEIGAAREASAVAPAAAPGFVPPSALSLSKGPDLAPAAFGASTAGAAVDGEEIYQLIKRSDVSPHEVEDVGAQAVEVSVLWKTSILHVAHIDNAKNFTLTARDVKPAVDSKVLGGSLAVGGALMLAGASIIGSIGPQDTQVVRDAAGMKSMVVGGIGALTTLIGAGAASQLHHRHEDDLEDPGRFVVGSELLNGAAELPVIVNGGGTRFVFLPGATGEVELQGQKRSLEDLKAQGHARPSSAVPGGFEVNVQPEGRYRQEIGGLTVVAKVVAPGKIVAGHLKRDTPLIGAITGSGVVVAAIMATLHFAVSDSSGFLSASSDDDRLAELRAFIQRQQERQPEQQQQQNEDQTEGGTGTRHAGDEGKMGKRDAPVRNNRYAIKNNNQPPQLSRQQARDQVQNRGIFAALGALGGGAAGGASGIVSPFGGMTESGVDNQNANGNMTGDAVGDAFGYGGLGATGTGWGGGGTGEGTIGMGNIGTMGHGSGTGSGQGYGSGAGRGLRGRGTSGPTVRAAPPDISGLLSPEAIRRVVLRNLGQVNHCHEQGLAQNPNAAGRVTIRFVIGGTGSVMGSGVAGSTYPIASVGDCIANAVRRWQFPAPEGGGVVTVNYPFNLQPPDQ